MVFNAGTNKLYVAGGGGIAVLDGSSNKRIGGIVLRTTESVMDLAANPTTKRVYAHTLTSITVIDSATDTIVQTLSGAEFLSVAYLPAADRLFTLQFDATSSLEIVVRDGATLGQITVALSGTNTGSLPQVPNHLIAVPGTNQVLGYWVEPPAPSTFFWFFDASGALLDQSACSSTICTKIAGGAIGGALVNPLDNKVWAYAIVQTATVGGGGDEAGAGPIPFPLSTALLPVNDPLPQIVGNFNVWGGFTPLAFDPSGKIVGGATCVPSTTTPSASENPCLGLASGLYAVDSATPLGTYGQLIDLNHFQGGPANQTTSQCLGVPLGYDADLGYGYFSCNGSGNGAVGNITVVKYNLAQAPDTSVFPPRIVGQWVGELQTHALNPPQVTGAMAINRATHRVFFPNPPDNSMVSVDPSAFTLWTELLSSRPGSIVVNSATNTVVVAEDTAAEITTVNGATNSVTALHLPLANGPYLDVNPVTGQLVAAGSADNYLDPTHTHNAFLYNGSGTALLGNLSAAASGSIIFVPSVSTGQGVSVNSATNRAYILDQFEWYVVDLATGNRIFTGYDFAGGTIPTCEFSGLAVNPKANRYYLVGQCPGSISGSYTLGVFDGNTNAPINVATLANFSTTAGGGWGPIAVNPNTNRLYIQLLQTTPATATSGPVSTTMVVTYDGTNLTRLDMPRTAAGGPMPVSFPLAINTASNRVYATVSSSTTNPATAPELVVLDGSVDAFGRTDIVIGQQPMHVRAIGVNTATGLAYVASDSPLPLPGQAALTGPGLNVFQEPPVPPKFSISGVVTKSGVGVAGVSLAISSSITVGTTVVTDASGAWTLAGVTAGTYTVAPTTAGFVYTPASQTVTIRNANATGINFAATPAFHISGRVLDSNGNGLGQQSVGNSQIGFSVTDATGAFSISNVIPGTYTISIGGAGAACCFAPITVTVASSDVTGLVFNQLPPVVITSLAFSPNMIGSGVVSTGTVTLANPAPPGGITVNVLDAASKAVKAPATMTIPAAATGGTFTIQGNGVSAPTTVNFTVQYFGTFSPVTAAFANASVTVAPTDSLKIQSATWSQSTQLLTVNATSTNAQATLTVILSSTKQPLGTMVNQGSAKFTYQAPFTSGVPASVNLTSNLGGSTGQGVAVVP